MIPFSVIIVFSAFTLTSMMDILRNQESGICRVGKSGSATTGSMVCVLYPAGANSTSHHWFTATPNPSCSVFKPFIFCANVVPCSLTVSPSYGAEDPAKVKPRFQKQVDRKHALYKGHQNIKPLPGDDVNTSVLDILKSMENQCIDGVQEYLKEFGNSKNDEFSDLFKDTVETEYKFYNIK